MQSTLLSDTERRQLINSLRRNEVGDALLMGRDTSFAGTLSKAGTDGAQEIERVVDCVRSVPCHY